MAMRRARHLLRLIAWAAAMSLAFALPGCSLAGNTSASPGASVTPAANATTPTTIPHSIAAFTCDADSLPVRPVSTRTSCSVGTQFGVEVLRATYANSSGSPPSVAENDLTTSGWRIATAAHGDGAVTSQGYGVYLYQSAWFVFEWTGHSNGSFSLTVQTSVPPGAMPIACGQPPAVGSARLKGIVLPVNAFMISILNTTAAFVPACADDVRSFYEALLPAAGWHEDHPFANVNSDPNSTEPKAAVFTRGGAKATITTSGYSGTQTLIFIEVHG